MFKRSRKATFLLVICIVYVFDVTLSGTMFGWMKTYASPDPVQIISIFVDKEIAGSIGNELNWFANTYIGRNEKNAKVEIFTIDRNTITAADMVKINQNLFLEGEKTGPSRLIGTILIGDLRLPIVNKQGFIFPTVYPLVDFEKPKYYYNPKSDYFEYQSEGNSQPEIRHSIINFKNSSSDYTKYFAKLKKYAADPEKWVSNDMWYEDIIHEKQTANGDNFDKYINNYVFSEDVMYNRYTNLMVDVFNALHNSGVVHILSGYNDQVGVNLDDEYYNDAEFSAVKGEYKKEIEKFRNLIKNLKKIIGDANNSNGSSDPEPSQSSLGTLPNSKFINTLFIQKVVDGFMKDYVELYGTSYFNSKEDRLALGGKYTGGTSGAKADDHITIATKRDEVSKQVMMDINTKLEKGVDDKIESEGYAMNVIVPTRINKKKKEVFEVYYFGLPAEQIMDASQFSIYRGTFNNIRSLSKLDKYNYASWMDYNQMQSIGATRGENSREVEASRGYDFSLLDYDQQEFERVKNAMPYKKHKKKRKNIDKFINYYRAGYTPLNIDPNSSDLRLKMGRMDYTQLWNPFKDRSLGGWVFNIAGSRITSNERKIGFTLGSEDNDDGDGSDDDDDQTISNTKSYSGYSDSYLGAEFFASAIRVTRDSGKRLKVHKRRVRKGGKPRISNREDINLWNLGNGSANDGLFLLANGRQNNRPDQIHPEDYITVQPKSDDNRNRYFKSIDSRYFHKSPTLEDVYGEYINLEQVNIKAEMACDDTNEVDENEAPQNCSGFSFKFTDLYPGTVVTNLYAKRGDDYIVTGGKVYFNSTAVRYEHDQEINFDGLIGEITGGNKLYLRFDNRDIYLPWGESSFDCEELNTDEDELGSCEGVSFKINGHDIAPISEKFVDIRNTGTLIEFYDGASILVYGKSYDLGGFKAILDKDTKVATFTGKKLLIGGINEFTLERPIDSPRYVNFQGIAGDKITWVYPDVRKIPVFKEQDGKRQLMNISEIEKSISDYLYNKVKDYNADLTKQYANRFTYYNSKENGVPKKFWIEKLDNYDWTISPLVQADNTGMKLRSYQFLPDDFLLDLLSTTRKGKSIPKEDMIKVLAEQLYFQNVMWQELPIDASKKILNEMSLITSFADINYKSSEILKDYIRKHDISNLQNPEALELSLPYYNSGGYELGYINSDGSDYIQFETTPPLIKLIQKQKAKSNDAGAKTKSQLQDMGKCGSKIPPNYVVSLTKWPQAFKCRLEDINSSVAFKISISFAGSANDVFVGSGFKGIINGIAGVGSEVDTQMRQSGKKYSQERRILLKGKDKDIPTDVYKNLNSKLENILPEFSTKYPQVDSGVTITLNQKADLGSYTIELFSTGSNCFIGNGGNLCKTSSVNLKSGLPYVASYSLENPNGLGDMIFQIKMCLQGKCVYRNTLLTIQAGEIASMKIVSPLGGQAIPVARGNTLPLVLQGFDKNNNLISTSIYNFTVTTSSSGGLIYNNQLTNRFELNSFIDAGFIYDSYSTLGGNESIKVISSDGLSPVKQELQLQVVEPDISINTSSTSYTLPDLSSALEKEQNGESYIDLSKLVKLSVSINANQPIYSLVSATSLGGKFIVGRKVKKKIGLGLNTKLVDTFQPVNEFIFTGGGLDLYLYPTMKAGDDSIEVKVGNTSKNQIISILPAKAKKTVLSFDDTVLDIKGQTKGILKVTDIRGNIIQTDTKVLLGLFGNISTDEVSGSGSTITVAGEKELSINAKSPGGQAYIFATLPGISLDDQYPDYTSLLVQNKSRPTDKLNIAYLNLYGSHRGTQLDPINNKPIAPSILQDSEKILAVTTQNVSLGNIYKSVIGIRSDGNLISFNGVAMSGSQFPVTMIGGVSGYVTDYGWLPFVGGLDILKEKWKASVDASKYQVVLMDDGQTQNQILVLQELGSNLIEFDTSVPSIEKSSDPQYNIGFGEYFKPMTNFAQGESVGESSTNYASEYVINLGDPSYRAGETRKLVDHTEYDAGVGRVIYSDPGKRIEQVMDIDRDKSGDKDLLIIYADGAIRLLLAVGDGSYEPIGDIAYIADGIKKVYVGDGDGDGRQDVFVHTSANQLRFYKNYDGKRIDVDGYPICLGIDDNLIDQNMDGGTKLDTVYQWFLTDPNKDKVTDIVVLDKDNTIQLFLGGGASSLFEIGFGGGNYISRDKLACDPGWKQRQKNKKSIVKSYAPQINDVEIRDESLVHRNGLKNTDIGTINPNAGDLEGPDKVDATITIADPGKKPSASKIKQLIGNIKDQVLDIANPKKLLSDYTASLENTVTLDNFYKPSYENGTGQIVYKQLSSLLPSDKLDIYKKFIDLNGGRLEDGDVVKVEIHVKNKGSSKATYIEKLSGPRDVPLSGGRQVGFFAGNLNADHQFILAPGPSYVFMVDNISVASDLTFGYHVVYKSQQLVTMKHGEDFIEENGLKGSIGKIIGKAWAQSVDSDLPAWLEVSPLDGCAKFLWKIFAENLGGSISSRFRESKIDLKKEIEEQQNKEEKEFSSGFKNSFNDALSDTEAGITKEFQDGYLKETWRQKGMLAEDPALQDIEYIANSLETFGNLSLKSNMNIGLFGSDVDNALDKKIGDLTKGLCEGFKIGQKSCSGLPILSSLPRNMAFLSPGDMQVMGCKIFKDKGLPLLWFPATIPPTPVTPPLPTIGPIGQKGPGDGFYWVGGGTYTSLVRVYFSPTLTAKLGIGVCFGPYSMGINFPKPFKDIAGNCIVFAVDPGLGKCEVEKNKETGTYVLPKVLKNFDTDSVCNDDITVKNGPLKMVETAVNNGDNRLDSAQGQYGLVIKLGGHANLTNYNSISLSDFVDKTRIEGGHPLNLKVKSAMDFGLVSCVMNQFADNQIRYIINNLTNLNLNVIIPDRKGLVGQGQIIGNSIANAKTMDYDLPKNDGSFVSAFTGNDKQKISKKLDATLSNPMDKLAILFSESELIHVSTRDVLIEIPRVYSADIGKLKNIYLSRLSRNKPIMDARDKTAKDAMQQCKKIQDQFERETCERSADTILQINNQMGQFSRSVRLNIETLNLYGQLPKQVYELLHGYDAYIYDVFNLAYGTIDAVTSWFSKVARGLDAWISFIISLTGIIKSWQILIDFSVNWREKCSKCTVDNYSAYSCSFKGFCPKLPVFAIPPFKIPSITLDLSNLDLSTDIILPRFRFQPKRVGLFDNLMQFGFPDIPYPPGINGSLDIKLPVIPVIPRPPDLSAISLPSFIPQIKFQGPTMPPAPRIPKIAPELGMAIDIASFIGRIYCIVKGGIGLVAEAGLKSRIEQMTQRTWNVEPFDSLRLLTPNAPLQTRNLFKVNKNQGGSFDLKFQAFADVRSYFDQIYGIFDGVAEVVNSATRKVVRDSDQMPDVVKADDWLTNKLYEPTNLFKDGSKIDDVIEGVDENYNSTIKVTPFGYVETSDYSIMNNKIAGDLDYFSSRDDQTNNSKRALLAGDIKRSYTLETMPQLNAEGLENIKQQAGQIMDSELKHNNEQTNRVQQDYDGWLEHIVNTQYVSNDAIDISLKAPIGLLKKETLDYVSSYDIGAEYISTQKHVVDGYTMALQQSDHVTLGMNKSDYDQSLDYLKRLQANIATTQNARSTIDDSQEIVTTTCAMCNTTTTTSQVAGSPQPGGSLLLAQGGNNNGTNNGGASDIVGGTTTDPAAFIRGYFVKGDDDNYHNVIANLDKGEELSHVMIEKDLDGDKKRELISRDDHNVYIKTTKQIKQKQGGGAQVDAYNFNTISDIEKEVDAYGYSNNLKIRSELYMPKERKVAGQTYQSMSYSVMPEGGISNGIDGFIVRYTDTITSSYAKDSDYNYVLILHSSRQGREIGGINIDDKKINISEIRIEYSDMSNEDLGVVLSNLPRRRYHTQIAKIQGSEYSNPLLKFIPFVSKKSSLLLEKRSPRSLPETAGMQVIADTSSPYATVSLQREKSNKVVTQGDLMYGTIKTYYMLTGNWFDDSRVVKSWILDGNNKVISSGETDHIYIPGIYSDKPVTLTYQLIGEDAAGNIGNKTITINLQLPTMTLDDVTVNDLGQSEATSNLNTDVDLGQVQFVRIRNGNESILQSAFGGKSLFDAVTNQTEVIGGKFAFKQDIGFYDSNGKYLNVSITPEGQIINNNTSIKTSVDFRDGSPVIILLQNNQELYTIRLKAKEMDGKNAISLLDGGYEILSLSNDVTQLGVFSKGYCIKSKQGVCEILIAPNGYMNVLKPYNRIYTADYSFENGKVNYTLKKGKNSIMELQLKVDEVKK